MGNYNPHWREVLGLEWVPAKDEQVLLTMENNYEIGHEFEITDSGIDIEEFMIYSPFWPTQGFTGVISTHLYPLNTEEYSGRINSGPIKKVLIPPAHITISGIGVFHQDESTLPGQGFDDSVLLTSPADFNAVTFDFDQAGITTIPNRAWIGFHTEKYLDLLRNKRILDVKFIYAAYTNIITGTLAEQDSEPLNAPPLQIVFVSANSPSSPDRVRASVSGEIDANSRQGSVVDFKEYSIGTHNYMSGNWAGSPPFDFQDIDEWDFSYLNQFRRNSPSTFYRIEINDQFQGLDHSINPDRQVVITFAALEITYCEEQRYARGGTLFEIEEIYHQRGINRTDLFKPITLEFPDDVPPGRYLATIGSGHIGAGTNFASRSRTFPALNAVREMVPISTHPGKEIIIPLIEDEVFQERDTHTMVQLSLHEVSSLPTSTHVYGKRIEAHVFTDILRTPKITGIAEQTLLTLGPDTQRPQLRFYARRFGDSGDLILAGVTGTITGSTFTLTAAEFDELPEIIDGFKEINGRFSVPPISSEVTDLTFRWYSPTTNFPGSRWEILGASAIAVTGATPKAASTQSGFASTFAIQYGLSDYLLRVQGDFDPSEITYGSIEGLFSGETRAARWYPGHYAPLVTGAVLDPTSDLVLLISADPPTITGFNVTTEAQELSAFMECGESTCCIPTSLYYNKINWSESSMQVTGFGGYELQRSDDYTEWKTIMLSTNRSITSFNDYESRVGVESRYRIRQLNVLNFAGFWSLTGSATITGLGADVPACGDGKSGLLLFTSNEHQDGSSNLAYPPVWESGVNEDFENVESNNVEIHRFHDRDYQTAFHGTERGGDAFNRTLLLTNAGVGGPSHRVPRSILDLAWSDLDYVCVRDDVGDRWFAHIAIPNSSMRRNRKIQMVELAVIEVTDTPTQVDP